MLQAKTMSRSLVARRAASSAPISWRSRLPSRNAARVNAASAGTSLKEAPLIKVVNEEGKVAQFPTAPGVYAVFDPSEVLQYIGLSRRIDASVVSHLGELPELTHGVKAYVVSHATRDSLMDAWKQWVEEAVATSGAIPPGNAPGEKRWQPKTARPARPEIRLTSGKGLSGITIEQLVDQVVKDVKVLAFVKGTRTQPQCGFSYKVLNMLNTLQAEYEVVNVLDDVHNPGLRDAIKTYSQWPTIPQLYIAGEFVGGTDICEEMFNSGELAKLVSAAKKAGSGGGSGGGGSEGQQ